MDEVAQYLEATNKALFEILNLTDRLKNRDGISFKNTSIEKFEKTYFQIIKSSKNENFLERLKSNAGVFGGNYYQAKKNYLQLKSYDNQKGIIALEAFRELSAHLTEMIKILDDIFLLQYDSRIFIQNYLVFTAKETQYWQDEFAQLKNETQLADTGVLLLKKT